MFVLSPRTRESSGQAHTLNAIFNDLARKAAKSEYINQMESHLRLALKAQGQCRATLETLAAIKNPQPVAFVRQANIAHGPQQVNNSGAEDRRAPESPANARGRTAWLVSLTISVAAFAGVPYHRFGTSVRDSHSSPPGVARERAVTREGIA
jgi:hypothetical protein